MPRKKQPPPLTWRQTQKVLAQIAGADKSTAASTATGFSPWQDFTRSDKPIEQKEK